MLPVLQVGPLAIQVPGLVLLLGLWLGLSLAERHASKRGIDPNLLYNLTLIGLLAGVLGSRLIYVARYPASFAASPLSLFSLNPGLLDPLGGVAIGLIAALIYANRKKLELLPTLDALTPLLAVMSVAMGLANLASGSAFGKPTVMPWGIELWGEVRHPAQVYQTLAAVALLVIFWPARQRFMVWKPGVYFLAFLASSAAVRLFLETFRGDSTLTAYGLRTAQLFAWVILAISLFALYRIHRTQTPANTLP
jgi:prolipoprotein diacylglyceryltransferase